MPTRLPNGLLIFNATTHVLIFHDAQWKHPNWKIVESDGRVINAYANVTKVKEVNGVEFVTTFFSPVPDGLNIIQSVREEYPDALIVGSVIAAQAYPEEVVAPVPWHRGRENKHQKQMRPNRFSIFRKQETQYNG
jgi:hypothetical protein